MSGRSVFLSPEADGSNVLKRCIITNEIDHERLSAVAARIILERRAMSDADIAAEIVEYEEDLRNQQI